MTARVEFVSAFFQKQPAAAARLLESMPPADARAVLQATPAHDTARVLALMMPNLAAGCLEVLPVPLMAAVLERLPGQSAAMLLRHVDDSVRNAVLAELGGARAAAIRLVLRYPRTAVGAWMDTEAVALPHDLDAREARQRLEAARGGGSRIYVLDREHKVRGVVDGLALLRDRGRGRIETLAESTEALWAREPLEITKDRDLWQRENEAPVVNRQDEFIGVITHRNVTRGVRELIHPRGHGAAGHETSEVLEALASGLQGAWASLAEILEPNRQATRERER